ncbi:CBS domain-containing protein [Psychrobacter sanguinis]|uniref:CBS domain-containing protein n=1 Tax=Psychrobacter sanguinis TaxID=861445 RepID=UPI0019193114|nr:CBS domain-containing protein [Psychrobacter sanguinis]MCC3309165.1 CBS domain-containing protein [Psychrobacter sanguinis]UEC26441.1 CBS domain-containing protein [Psychrobacter sanguinis]
MNNSENFLETYNNLDQYLNKEVRADNHVGYANKVKNSKNAIVSRFKDELLSFGTLRNAIVHNPKIGNKAIAEPHDSTVKRFNEIYEMIINPKKVIPTFQFDVLGAQKDDYINDILKKMKQKSFSQFPVLDSNGTIIELINNNTISRWLASKIDENGTIIIDGITIEKLMPEIEFKHNYKFISRETSIYKAYDLFLNHINEKERNLDVLFITHSGRETEKLLGLITISDLSPLI